MNIHITHDDKFLDFFIENEENYTNTLNRYIVYSNEEKLKYIKSDKIEIISSNYSDLKRLSNEIKKEDVVYIHYLSEVLIDFISLIQIEIPIVWIFWGADGFTLLPKYENLFFLKKTKHIQLDTKVKMNWCINPFYLYKNSIRFFKQTKELKKQISTNIRKFEIIKNKITYFAHYIPKDLELFVNKLKINYKWIDFNYMSTIQMDKSDVKKQPKRNIIVGNSANPSNNHLDIFNELSHYDLSNFDKIYCPLSYGNKNYANIIIKYGYKFFKEKFIPLTSFLSYFEYMNILNSCKIGIFGMKRSQASGNIIALLNQGCAIYMKKENTLFDLLKTNNIKIYNIEEDMPIHLKDKDEAIFKSLEITYNKKMLENLFGEEIVKQKYNQLLNINQFI